MGAIFTRPMFKKVKTIIFENVASTSAGAVDTISSTDYGENFSVTVQCSTGTIYINPLAAATTTNGFALQENESLELKVENQLSIIGDSTTAAYQAIVWE